MKCRVHYVSPRGSAETIAEAIASDAMCEKEPLLPAYMPEGVQLMFLGCEGSRADKVTLQYISQMTPARVRHAALFACGHFPAYAIEQMRTALIAKGIDVLEDALAVQMKCMLCAKPKADDILAAHAFAKSCMREVEGK